MFYMFFPLCEDVFRSYDTLHFSCQILFSQPSNIIDDDMYVMTIVSRVTLYGQSETFKGAITVIRVWKNRKRNLKSVTSLVFYY